MLTPRGELALLMLALYLSGVRLAPHPDDPTRLRHRPAHLPTHLADGLGRHKAAILRLLREGDGAEKTAGEGA
ncbi:MAG: hypothetical protein KIS87_05570 [Phycisphaeraceae bacterium]|nr:hypothetical protein [Phycisphaeraceae bacterium]